MLHNPVTLPLDICYRAPGSVRFGHGLGLLFLAGVFALLTSIIVLTAANWAPMATITGHPAAEVALLAACVLAMWLLMLIALRSAPSRVEVSAEGLRFVGWGVTLRRIQFDDIRFIELDPPRYHSGDKPPKRLTLKVFARRGGKGRIILVRDQAFEAFHTIRDVCLTIPGVGPNAEVYPPEDPAYDDAARAVLIGVFKRRAVLQRVWCGWFIVFGVGTVVALALVPAARTKPKLWLVALFFPILAWRAAKQAGAWSAAAHHLRLQPPRDLTPDWDDALA